MGKKDKQPPEGDRKQALEEAKPASKAAAPATAASATAERLAKKEVVKEGGASAGDEAAPAPLQEEGGALSAASEAMVQHVAFIADDEELQQFLLGFPLFYTPLQLLHGFSAAHAAVAAEEGDDVTAIVEIRKMSSRFIKAFVTACSAELLATSPEFRTALAGVAEESLSRDEAKKLKELAEERAATYEVAATSMPVRPRGELIEYDEMAEVDVLSFSSAELTEALCLIKQKLFCSISHEQLLRWKYPRDSPALCEFASNFNLVSSWVAAEVVAAGPDISRQAEIVQHFISVGYKSLAHKNYNTAVEVLCGLNNSSVMRLRPVWDAVPAKFTTMLQYIEDQHSPLRNFANYRQSLAAVQGPHVPYLAAHIKDLTFADDGNATLLANGKVNYEKLLIFGNILGQLEEARRQPYTFEVSDGVMHYLDNMWWMSEEDLRCCSLAQRPLRSAANTINQASHLSSGGLRSKSLTHASLEDMRNFAQKKGLLAAKATTIETSLFAVDDIIARIQTKMDVRTRLFYRRSVPDCLVAYELVTFFVEEELVKTRDEGRQLGQYLFSKDLLQPADPLLPITEFADAYHLVRVNASKVFDQVFLCEEAADDDPRAKTDQCLAVAMANGMVGVKQRCFWSPDLLVTKCFSGLDVANWICANMSVGEEEAVALARRLFARKYIVAINPATTEYTGDDQSLYRCNTEQKQKRTINLESRISMRTFGDKEEEEYDDEAYVSAVQRKRSNDANLVARATSAFPGIPLKTVEDNPTNRQTRKPRRSRSEGSSKESCEVGEGDVLQRATPEKVFERLREASLGGSTLRTAEVKIKGRKHRVFTGEGLVRWMASVFAVDTDEAAGTAAVLCATGKVVSRSSDTTGFKPSPGCLYSVGKPKKKWGLSGSSLRLAEAGGKKSGARGAKAEKGRKRKKEAPATSGATKGAKDESAKERESPSTERKKSVSKDDAASVNAKGDEDVAGTETADKTITDKSSSTLKDDSEAEDSDAVFEEVEESEEEDSDDEAAEAAAAAAIAILAREMSDEERASEAAFALAREEAEKEEEEEKTRTVATYDGETEEREAKKETEAEVEAEVDALEPQSEKGDENNATDSVANYSDAKITADDGSGEETGGEEEEEEEEAEANAEAEKGTGDTGEEKGRDEAEGKGETSSRDGSEAQEAAPASSAPSSQEPSPAGSPREEEVAAKEAKEDERTGGREATSPKAKSRSKPVRFRSLKKIHSKALRSSKTSAAESGQQKESGDAAPSSPRSLIADGEDLFQLAAEMAEKATGVPLEAKQKNCFSGKEGTAWIMRRLDLSVAEAVQVGNELLQHKLVKSMANNRPFTDAGGMYYRVQPKKKRRGLFAGVDKNRRRSSWTHSVAAKGERRTSIADKAITEEQPSEEAIESPEVASPREEEGSEVMDSVVERQRSATVATPADLETSDDGDEAEQPLSPKAVREAADRKEEESPRVVSPFAIPAGAMDDAPATARSEGPALSPKVVEEEKSKMKEKKSSKKRERSKIKQEAKKDKKKIRKAAKTLAPPSSERNAEAREATHTHLSAVALLYHPTEGLSFSPSPDGRFACDEEEARALVGGSSLEALLESGLLVAPQPGRLCLAFAL